MNLPTTHNQTMWLHADILGNLLLLHNENGDDFYTCLGPVEITVDVPQLTPDEIVGRKIDGLKKERTKIMGEMQHKIDQIDDKIQSLLALEAPK